MLYYSDQLAQQDATLTQDQLAARSQAATLPSYNSYTPPNASSPVSSSSLTSGSLNYPSGTTPDNGSTAFASAVGGANATASPESATPNLDMAATGDYTTDPGYKQALSSYNTSVNNYQTAANGLPSSADLLTSEQNASGATEKMAEVNKLKAELAASTAAYNNEFAQTETQGIKNGVPALFYQGEIAAKQRQAAIITTGIASRLAAAQDNWQMAETLAEKTASLKYADAQQKVDNMFKFIQLNADNVSRAEKVAISKMEVQAKKLQEQIDQYKANMQLAMQGGITTKYTNHAGEIFRTSDGKAFSTPEEFFKDAGVSSFEEASAKGLIGNYNPNTPVERDILANMIAKYPDAGIRMTDTAQMAESKLKNSRIYQDQVRGPVGAGGAGGGVLGLSNQQIDNISPLVTQFQNSPIVRNYNVLGEARNFANSISNTTKNPTDDQALIYTIAKALDPDSVVREGEYATVQKYAQSWAQAYGKSVSQAFLGTGFLSTEARQNIKATLEARFRATEISYKNLSTETERRINLIGNTDKGGQLINNYGGAFAPQSSASTGFIGPIAPAQIVTTPETKSWWQKTTNWLWGAD